MGTMVGGSCISESDPEGRMGDPVGEIYLLRDECGGLGLLVILLLLFCDLGDRLPPDDLKEEEALEEWDPP